MFLRQYLAHAKHSINLGSRIHHVEPDMMKLITAAWTQQISDGEYTVQKLLLGLRRRVSSPAKTKMCQQQIREISQVQKLLTL